LKVEVLRQGLCGGASTVAAAGSDVHFGARAATPLVSWSWQLCDVAPARAGTVESTDPGKAPGARPRCAINGTHGNTHN
jgi:hypothetical protein